MNIKPEITVRNKDSGEKILYRMDQPSLVIGRDSSNFVVLPSKTVSRRHTEILFDHGQFFVRDLKSNNGTKLGERKLTTKEKNLLKSGDVIKIENFDILFELPQHSHQKEALENTDSDLLEVKMVKKLLKAMDKDSAPTLEIIDGAEKGRRFLFEAKSQDVVVGRDPGCELYIDSNVISRKHARFEKRFDTVTIFDLDSKNGTFVNRQKITEKRLQDGDVIHLGTLAIIFRNPQELGLDLSPPEISSTEEHSQHTNPNASLPEEPSQPKIDLPEAKVAKRRGPEDPPPPAPKTPEPIPQPLQAESNFNLSPADPLPQSEVNEAPKLSSMEILMLAVGAAVLIGALFGLMKIF
ncbi:MAG: FHA domain-containing protein [Deltaproteobacteria bacterium]|nr:MAG: FHA domain-containing protein [Deltaproteobacteria bacterium]